MISDRFAPGLAALVALSLVPTVIHSYLGLTADDDRRTSSLPTRIADYASVRTDRDEGWGGRRFESHDWVERRYLSNVDDVIVTALRSFDAKKLYHHPELDIAYGTSFTNSRLDALGDLPGVPVHVLTTSRPGGPMALYVLQYGREFVGDPLRFQFRIALKSLWSRRQVMTLIFVHDPVTPPAAHASIAELPSAAVLAGLVRAFDGTSPAAGR